MVIAWHRVRRWPRLSIAPVAREKHRGPLGLILGIVVLIGFLVCGQSSCGHAEWLSANPLFFSGPSWSVAAPAQWSWASGQSGGGSVWEFFPWAGGLFYPQSLWWSIGWPENQAISSVWGAAWPIFPADPITSSLAGYETASSLLLRAYLLDTLLINTFSNPWLLLSRSAFSSRTAANANPPLVDRRTVGIESRQVLYKSSALQTAKFSSVPGIPAYRANQVVVQFVPGTSSSEVGRICARHGYREVYTSPYSGYTILSIPSSIPVIEAARRLQAELSVLVAEPNYLRHAHFVPNDPYYHYQWHLSRLNCEYAWDYSSGAGVVVGLIDSGVAFETNGTFRQAPDLAGTLFVPGYDFVNNDAFPDDDYGHGTHMAGCIAQTTNNLLGVAGVAFNAAIMPVKVMDNIGGVVISTEVDGIYFAANNGAKVISMSLGGPGTSAIEAAAITYAYNNGATIVCSAGNSGSSTPEYPASYPEPISVSAIRYDYTLPSYSNYGTYVDVCSPGGDLSVDQNLDGFGDGILQQTHDGKNYTTFYYYFMEGTSPACALVSGVAALIIGKSTIPLAPVDVVSIIKSTATDLGTAGWDQYFGYGLVNAYLAVLRTP
ncbi:MAG: S8 family peptidase [bacterium]|nr:S8 family peptidase [bacterium]